MTHEPADSSKRVRIAQICLRFIGLALVVFLISVSGKKWSLGLDTWSNSPKPKLIDLVHGCWWWAAVGNFMLCCTLTATARWWAKKGSTHEQTASAPFSRRFWLGLLVIIAIAAALRAPRLGLSLYNDESYAFRTHIAGAYADAKPGEITPPTFKPQTWLNTCYLNSRGNNSMLYSVLARASYDTWLSATGTPRGVINETALRLPVLLASLLGIAVLAALGHRLGGARLGLILALLAAFHPWHMRYSVEARCYGLLFLLLPLLAYCLDRAWHTQRWRWWLAFAGVQFLTLNSFFGCVFLIALLNAILIAHGLISWHRHNHSPALWRTVQLGIAGLIAAMLYAQTSLPLYLQNQRFLAQTDVLRGSFDWPWFADLGSLLLAGIPAFDLDPTNALSHSAVHQPWHLFFMLVLLIGTLGIVLMQLLLEAPRHTQLPLQSPANHSLLIAMTFSLASIGGLFATVAVFMAKGLTLLTWYGIFVLPAVILLLGYGITWLSHRAGWLSASAVIAILLLGWLRPIEHFAKYSREDLRSPIEHVHAQPYPALLTDGKNISMGCFWSNSPIYDPRIVPLWKKEELQAMIQHARSTHTPLWIEHAFSDSARREQPELYALVHDTTLFEFIKTFPGLDYEMSTHYLFRLKP